MKEGGKAGTLSVPVVAGLGSELLFMVSYTFPCHVIYLKDVLLVRVLCRDWSLSVIGRTFFIVTFVQ